MYVDHLLKTQKTHQKKAISIGMADVLKVLDDIAFGARMARKEIPMQYTKSGIHIMYVVLLFVLAIIVLLFLLYWAKTK